MKEWSDLSLWAEGMKQIEKDIEKTKDLITKEYEKCIRKRCAEACAEPWLAFKKFAPPSTPDFSGEVGLNLAFGRLLPVEVIRLHVGDLHAVGWGHGGPWALATPVKAVRVGLKKEMFVDTNKERKVHMSKFGSE